MTAPRITEADPFELPEWLGLGEVEWTTESPLVGAGLVTGRLRQDDHSHPADLLAADRAYPVVSLPDPWRTPAHQAWTHGEVLLLEIDGRLTLAVPGHAFTVDLALEGLRRLARAVGVPAHRFVAALRL